MNYSERCGKLLYRSIAQDNEICRDINWKLNSRGLVYGQPHFLLWCITCLDVWTSLKAFVSNRLVIKFWTDMCRWTSKLPEWCYVNIWRDIDSGEQRDKITEFEKDNIGYVRWRRLCRLQTRLVHLYFVLFEKLFNVMAWALYSWSFHCHIMTWQVVHSSYCAI